MSFAEQIFYAKDAVHILNQNGDIRHADAISELLETIQQMEIKMSEMEMKKD